MNSIGVTRKILVCRLDVIEQLLKVFKYDQKRANVVFRRLGKFRVNHILPSAALGVMPINELTASSAIRAINWHCNSSACAA